MRQATIKDLPEIVRMLADDFLGQQRERLKDPLPESYIKAFREIEADQNNELIVTELDGEIVGTLQLTLRRRSVFRAGSDARWNRYGLTSSIAAKGSGER